VTGALLAAIGLAEVGRRLRAQGAPSFELDAALSSLNVMLDAATTDPTALDSVVARQLMAAYRLVYIASYEQVLLIIAAVCVIAGAAFWFGHRTRSEAEDLTLVRQ